MNRNLFKFTLLLCASLLTLWTHAQSSPTQQALPYSPDFSAVTQDTAPNLINQIGWTQINAQTGDYLDSIMSFEFNAGTAFQSFSYFRTALQRMAPGATIPDRIRLPFYSVEVGQSGNNNIVILAAPTDCQHRATQSPIVGDRVVNATSKRVLDPVTNQWTSVADNTPLHFMNQPIPLYFILPEIAAVNTATMRFGLAYSDYDMRNPETNSTGNLGLEPTGEVVIGYMTDPADTTTFVALARQDKRDFTQFVQMQNLLIAPNAHSLQQCSVNLAAVPQGARVVIKVEPYRPYRHYGNDYTLTPNDYHFHAIAINNILIEPTPAPFVCSTVHDLDQAAYTPDYTQLTQATGNDIVNDLCWGQIGAGTGEYMDEVMAYNSTAAGSNLGYVRVALQRMAPGATIPNRIKLPFYQVERGSNGNNNIVVLASPTDCRHAGRTELEIGDTVIPSTQRRVLVNGTWETVNGSDTLVYMRQPKPLLFVLPEMNDYRNSEMQFGLAYSDYDMRNPETESTNNLGLEPTGEVEIGYLDDPTDSASFHSIATMSKTRFTQFVTADALVTPPDAHALQSCTVRLNAVPAGKHVAIKINPYHPYYTYLTPATSTPNDYHFHAIALNNISITRVPDPCEQVYDLNTVASYVPDLSQVAQVTGANSVNDVCWQQYGAETGHSFSEVMSYDLSRNPQSRILFGLIMNKLCRGAQIQENTPLPHYFVGRDESNTVDNLLIFAAPTDCQYNYTGTAFAGDVVSTATERIDANENRTPGSFTLHSFSDPRPLYFELPKIANAAGGKMSFRLAYCDYDQRHPASKTDPMKVFSREASGQIYIGYFETPGDTSSFRIVGQSDRLLDKTLFPVVTNTSTGSSSFQACEIPLTGVPDTVNLVIKVEPYHPHYYIPGDATLTANDFHFHAIAINSIEITGPHAPCNVVHDIQTDGPYRPDLSQVAQTTGPNMVEDMCWRQYGAETGYSFNQVMSYTKNPLFLVAGRTMINRVLNKMCTGASLQTDTPLPYYYVGRNTAEGAVNNIVIFAAPTNCQYNYTDTPFAGDTAYQSTLAQTGAKVGDTLHFFRDPRPLYFELPELAHADSAVMSFTLAYCDYDMRHPNSKTDPNGVFTLDPDGGNVHIGYFATPGNPASYREIEMMDKHNFVEFSDSTASTTALKPCSVQLLGMPDTVRLVIKVDPYSPYYTTGGDQTSTPNDFHFHAIAINNIVVNKPGTCDIIYELPYEPDMQEIEKTDVDMVEDICWRQYGAETGHTLAEVNNFDLSRNPFARKMMNDILDKMCPGATLDQNQHMPFYYVGRDSASVRNLLVFAAPTDCQYNYNGTAFQGDTTYMSTNVSVSGTANGPLHFFRDPRPLYFVLPEISNVSGAKMSFGLAYCDYDQRHPASKYNIMKAFTLEQSGDVRIGFVTNPTDTATFHELPSSRVMLDKMNGNFAEYNDPSSDPSDLPMYTIRIDTVVPAGARIAIKINPYRPSYYVGHDYTKTPNDYHFHAIAMNKIRIYRDECEQTFSLPYAPDFMDVRTDTAADIINDICWNVYGAQDGAYIDDLMHYDMNANPTVKAEVTNIFNRLCPGAMMPNRIKLPFYQVSRNDNGTNNLMVLAHPNRCVSKSAINTAEVEEMMAYVSASTNFGHILLSRAQFYFELPLIENLNGATMAFNLGYCDYDQRHPNATGNGYGSLVLEKNGALSVGYFETPGDTSSFHRLDYVPDKMKYFRELNDTTASPYDLQHCVLHLNNIPDSVRLAIKVEQYVPYYAQNAKYGTPETTIANGGDYSNDYHFHAIVLNNLYIGRPEDNVGTYYINYDTVPVDSSIVYDATLLTAKQTRMMDKTRDVSLTDNAATTAITEWKTYSHEYSIPENTHFGYTDYNIRALSNNALSGLSADSLLAVRVPYTLTDFGTDPNAANTCFSGVDSLLLLVEHKDSIPTVLRMTGSDFTHFAGSGNITYGIYDYDADLTALAATLPAAADVKYASYPYTVYTKGFDPANIEISQRPFRDIHMEVEPLADSTGVVRNPNDSTIHVVTFTSCLAMDSMVVDTARTELFNGHLHDGEGEVAIVGSSYALINNGENIALNTYSGTKIFEHVDSLVIDCDHYNDAHTTQWSFENTADNADDYVTTNTVIRVRHTIDNLRYYWISQPFDVRLGDVVAKDENGTVVDLLTAHSVGNRTPEERQQDWWAIYEYSEAQRNGSRISYVQLTDPNTVLQANRGYAVAVVEAQSKIGTTFDVTLDLPSDTTAKILGSNSYAGYSIDNLTNSNPGQWYSGWQLVGNPFLHTMPGSAYGKYINTHDWTDTTAINKVKQWWTLSRDAVIPPFTAFSVQVENQTSIAVNPTNGSMVAAMAMAPEHFTVRISNGSADDETTVIGNSMASTDYVIGEDLSKISSGALSLYTINNDIRYAFNERPLDQDTVIIPLGVTAAQAGLYTFSLDGETTDFDGEVILHDLQNGTFTNLTNGAVSVEIGNGTINDRFEIVMNRKPVSVENATDGESVNAYVVNGHLFIDENLDNAHLAIYDAQGRTIFSEIVNGSLDYQFAVPGVYMITIRQADRINTIKVVY